MAKLYFIRHGLADKGWGEDPDPGLAVAGTAQAEAVALELKRLSPLKIFASPMKRCQETAAPLAALWGAAPTIQPAISEIPTPARLKLKDKTLADRAAWLQSLWSKSWRDMEQEASLLLWKKHLLDWVFHAGEDCVAFSHFIAINAVLGAAAKSDQFISARPNYCSVWVFDNSAGLKLVEAGAELQTKIL